MIYRNRQKNRPGFSLVEVITVLLVISIGMMGILNLIVQSIKSQHLNEYTLTAYQLAQEGVELIRARRDNNWREGLAWNDSLADGAYYMDYTMREPIAISGGDQFGMGRLVLDSQGFYTSSPTTGSLPAGQYSRIISLNNSEDGDKIGVRVSIYWYDRGQLNSYSLEAELYDWFAQASFSTP